MTVSPLQHQAQDAEGLRALSEKATPGRMSVFEGQPCDHSDDGGGGFTACIGGLRRVGSGRPSRRFAIADDTYPDIDAEVYPEARANFEFISALWNAYRAGELVFAASPPQAETPGLDREAAVSRLRSVIYQGNYVTLRDYQLAQEALAILARPENGRLDEARRSFAAYDAALDAQRKAVEEFDAAQDAINAISGIDDINRLTAAREAMWAASAAKGIALATFAEDFRAILAATAVSQPPTTRHGADDVEALGPRIITRTTCDGCPALATKRWEFYGDDDERDSGTDAKCFKADRHIASYWNSTDSAPDWCPAVLPAQPGPALSDIIGSKLAEPSFVAFSEALRANLTEPGHLLAFKVRPTGTASMWVRLASGREIIVGEDEWTPAQPGPAPVGDGDAIKAARSTLNEVKAWIDSDLPAGTPRAGAIHALVYKTRAALDSIPAAGGTGIPEGWRLVPVEPTEAMTTAVNWDGPHVTDIRAAHGPNTVSTTQAKLVYRAMLAAAPLSAAPTQTAREGGE